MSETNAIIIPAISDDGSLYPIEKLKAHQDKIFHLAVSVFVFDGDELLIQRRADHKYHCGGMWANTCCTHPHWEEDAAVAASRRMTEELGFTLPLEKRLVVEYSADVGGGLHEHERVTVFTAHIAKQDFKANLNPDEVSEIAWISYKDLVADIARSPDKYTPWFKIYAERFTGYRFEQ